MHSVTAHNFKFSPASIQKREFLSIMESGLRTADCGMEGEKEGRVCSMYQKQSRMDW